MLTATIICLVVGISDGDTLSVRCGEPGSYEQVKIRLSAIDAPESKQPFGDRARQHLAELCFQQQAKIKPLSQDRYRRTIADVECKGLDAGQEQVSAGMAWVYRQYAKNYQHLYALEQKASYARRGLWSDPAPIAPWDWRRPAK